MSVMSDALDITWSEPVSLFPLPNCVLLPSTTLPLLVFEPRYRTMVRDVLAADLHRTMAIALLREGYEELYHSNQAPIFPVVGVGTVVEYEELADGRYTIILRGLARATITVEDTTGPYRKAMLVPRESKPLPDREAVDEARQSLRRLLEQTASLSVWPVGATEQLFAAFPSVESLIDVIAFHAIPTDEVILKQRLLEEPDVAKRLAVLRMFLEQLIAMQRYSSWARPTAETWPPEGSDN